MANNARTEVNFGDVASVMLVALLAWLKAEDHLQISWLWVFAPIWLPLCLVIGAVIFLVIVVE
jgi:hypothetical protein